MGGGGSPRPPHPHSSHPQQVHGWRGCTLCPRSSHVPPPTPGTLPEQIKVDIEQGPRSRAERGGGGENCHPQTWQEEDGGTRGQAALSPCGNGEFLFLRLVSGTARTGVTRVPRRGNTHGGGDTLLAPLTWAGAVLPLLVGGLRVLQQQADGVGQLGGHSTHLLAPTNTPLRSPGPPPTLGPPAPPHP